MAGYKGKQGRKPKASTILERERAKEPQPRSGKRRMPSPPDHVRSNPEALAEWWRAGRILLDAGILDKADTSVLAALSIAYARWVDAEKHLYPYVDEEGKLQNYGPVIKTRMGAFIPSPYLPIANRAMEQVMKLSGELGMTPASRSRMPQAKAERRPRRAQSAPGPEGEADPRLALRIMEGGRG